MKKVLLDINVVLDVFCEREPHYPYSAQVLSLCAENKIRGFLSATSFGTVYYLLSKIQGQKKTILCLQKIRAFIEVGRVDKKVIDLALNSQFSDFEDAIQYYSAICNKCQVVVTRNKKDFLKSKIIVATPEEFLNLFSFH